MSEAVAPPRRRWRSGIALAVLALGTLVLLTKLDDDEPRSPPAQDEQRAAIVDPHPMLWALTGSTAEEYRLEYVPDSQLGVSLARLRSAVDAPTGFGALRRRIRAEPHLLESVTFSTDARMEAHATASLWMRVDDAAGDTLAYVDLGRAEVVPDGQWNHYSVAVDVPSTAEWISFGIYLDGPGVVCLRSPALRSSANGA